MISLPVLGSVVAIFGTTVAAHAADKDIKSYCLDFNWGGRRSFAAPGTWASADPAAHVAWYKAMGANVIQTFAISCNGYHGVSLEAVWKDGKLVEPVK